MVALKTTWGRVSTVGVWPLTPSLDTVGPMAADVAGVATGMRLLAPDWRGPVAPATAVGRLRIDGVDPAVEAAVDAALVTAGLSVHNVQLTGWDDSFETFSTLVLAEFWQAQHRLVDADGLTAATNRTLRRGSTVDAAALTAARAAQQAWRAEVVAALDRVPLLALPTLIGPPPRLSEVRGFDTTALTAPFNTAGVPAISLRPGDDDLKAGDQVLVDQFKPKDMVDVIGVSKGRGFAGVVKRHHFRGGESTHGSMFHRAPGSIGASSGSRHADGRPHGRCPRDGPQSGSDRRRHRGQRAGDQGRGSGAQRRLRAGAEGEEVTACRH